MDFGKKNFFQTKNEFSPSPNSFSCNFILSYILTDPLNSEPAFYLMKYT